MQTKHTGATVLTNGTAHITCNYSIEPVLLQGPNHPTQLYFPQSQTWFKG